MFITFFSGVTDTPDRAKTAHFEPSKFLDLLGSPDKWPSTECKTDADKLAGLGYVCAKYRNGARTKANAELDPGSQTELFVYDVDDMTVAELKAAGVIWRDYDCVIHSTFKHSASAPRLRLVVRLSEPVPNVADQPFKRLYAAGARVLGIKHDPVTLKVANFFLGPQHKPGMNGSIERIRFQGKPLDVSKLKTEPAIAPDTEATKQPTRKEVKKLADKLRKRSNDAQRTAGEMLKAALAGDEYGEKGRLHDIRVKTAFECVREWRDLDSEWFADTHLRVSWASTPPGAGQWEYRLKDWQAAVDSARAKFAEADAARARVRPDEAQALTDDEIADVRAHKGALVVSFGNAYYVYSPYEKRYTGPFKGAQVAIAFREFLGAVPGVSELDFRTNGPPGLKSSVKLNHEYGCTVDHVQYFAESPPVDFDPDERALKLKAYKWIDWPARFSECADELLRIVGGCKYSQFESYLYKFRDLGQPLPALTLIGPPGVWKSQIAQALSRFWCNRAAPTACRAEKVLFRFSAPLLENPVIWSDEKLATERGEHGIPEKYRESISEVVHTVERKGLDPVTLFSATRHVISVNEDEKVFSAEIDAASVEATLIRFLVLSVDKAEIDAFERKWTGTEELDRVREGGALLEQIRWIEENTTHTSAGRFWIDTATDLDMLWRARFADEVLTYCLIISLDALMAEVKHSVPGQVDRLPLICDEDGQLRISPKRINALWSDSHVVSGASVRKPAPTTIGRFLSKAGFKLYKNERACKNIHNAWCVDHITLHRFLNVSEWITWEDLENAVWKIWQVRIKAVPNGPADV